VYRTVDTNKDYYLLPVLQVEKESWKYIKDSESNAAFKVFVEDSRLLFKKFNKDVEEMTRLPKRYTMTPEIVEN
jgi:hypothetical protein